MEHEIQNLFQETSSEAELDDEWLQSSMQALEAKHTAMRELPMSCRFKLMIKECSLSS